MADRRPLIVGPVPPPYGGIATIVQALAGSRAAAQFQFFDTTKRSNGRLATVLRGVTTVTGLIAHLRRRPLSMFAFSSAHASFWEKALWLVFARAWRVPAAVMMVDGNFPAFHASRSMFGRWMIRVILEGFAVVIVQSDGWLRFFREIAPAGKYRVLSNGVHPRDFTLAPHHATDQPIVLFVGWLIPEKGVLDLIDAAALLRDRGLSFVVRLLGASHGYDAMIDERIAHHHLDGMVERLGQRADVRQAYVEADVFVLPSWAEGLPNALLEAMASGLPSVATSVGGMRDVIEHGISGLLVPERSPTQLASALEPLLRDRALRIRLGQGGRARVERSFDNGQFIAGLSDVLLHGVATGA